MTYELALPPVVESVGVGRRLVAEALEDWGLEDLIYTASLLTSEVLTNSVLHARTAMLLTVQRAGPEAVTIAVHDGSTLMPRQRRHSRDATTGRGLQLVEQLAQTWGVDTRHDGKTLHFTISAESDPWSEFAGTDWSDAEL